MTSLRVTSIYKFGKIDKGYVADIVIYDYHPPTPMANDNLAGHFLYGFSSRDVETVIVNGNVVYENREFPFDVKGLYKKPSTQLRDYGRRWITWGRREIIQLFQPASSCSSSFSDSQSKARSPRSLQAT